MSISAACFAIRLVNQVSQETVQTIGIAKGDGKGSWLPTKFLENIDFLFFERRFFLQNGGIRLKSNNLGPPPNPPQFLGWLRH